MQRVYLATALLGESELLDLDEPTVGLDVGGSAALVVLLAVLDAMLGTALALLLSAFARTEFQAVQFLPAVILPQLLLCGLLTPRETMAAPLQWLSDLVPLTYAVDGMQRVVATAEVTGALVTDLALVVGCVVGFLALAPSPCRAAPGDGTPTVGPPPRRQRREGGDPPGSPPELRLGGLLRYDDPRGRPCGGGRPGARPPLLRHEGRAVRRLARAAVRPDGRRAGAARRGDGRAGGAGGAHVPRYLGRGAGAGPLLALLRSAVSDERAQSLRDFVTRVVIGPLARAAGPEGTQLRASLVASQVVGLAMARYVVRLEPLASASPDELAPLIGPTLDRYLAAPTSDSPGGRPQA